MAEKPRENSSGRHTHEGGFYAAKIGIMGGTFNPIHNGHLLQAQEALEALALDEILFIPSGISYMKDSDEILDASTRVHLVKLAIEGNPHFSVSECEIYRQGPTYTCDTLTELRARHPENQYFFILGADSLFSLESWKDPEIIFESCVIAAAVRGAGTRERMECEAIRLKEVYHADIRIIPARHIDISSTEIRKRIRNGRSVQYMIPDKVLRYIQENCLYQEAVRKE